MHLVVKIIANRYALTFNSSNLESSSNTTIYKGVEVLYGVFGTNTTGSITPASNSHICEYEKSDTELTNFCSSYSNPISYVDASSNDTDK